MKSDKTTPNVPTLRFSNKTIWEKKRIKDFCEVNPKTEELEDEFIYIDLESVSKGCLLSKNIISKTNAPSRAQRVLTNNDILFQCVRPYQMNNLLFNAENTDFQYVASTGYAQIRTQENPSFVYHLLHSPNFNKEVMLRCTGSSYPAITSSDLGDIEVYICGVGEQQKIGHFLDLIDRRIAVQNKIIEDLKVLKKELNYSLIGRIINGKSSNCKIEDVIDYEQPTNYIVKSDKYIENGETPVLTANKAFLLGYTIENEGVYNKSDCIILDDFTLDFKYVNFPFKIKSSAIKILTAKKDIELRYFYEYLLFLGLTSHEHKRHYISEIAPLPLYLPSIDEQRSALSALNSISEKIKVEENYIIALKAQKCFFLRAMFI